MRALENVKLIWSFPMWRRIFTIARKEVKEALRNRWVIVLALFFLGQTVLISYSGLTTSGSQTWIGLEDTILYLTTDLELMIPILAVIFGYGSVVNEKEKGSIEMVLSYPLMRGELIAGKFLGLWAVLSAVVAGGLGLGGIVIYLNVSQVVWAEYYIFILASILLGGVYLSLSIMLSTIFERGSSALSGSIAFVLFFTFIWLFAVYALAELTFGWELVKQGSPPRWYFGLQMFNPLLIWYTLLALNIPPLQEWAMEFGGREPEYHPSYFDTWIMIILLIVWIAVPLLISEYILNRDDIH